jgi:sugar phosphate permease
MSNAVSSATAMAASPDIARRTMRKVELRLVPFCMLLFVVSFVDRINVSFAALKMNKALAIGNEAFATGVGLFFIGYFLFEVPSNLILHRVGARRWISRIVIGWGALTALHALVVGTGSFYSLRFLLGLAEAGFAPGLLFYFTQWFPQQYRGAIMSRYLTASAIAIIVGAPMSTSLFHLDGLFGIADWQWMFLVEGALGVGLGLITLFYLPDRPETAGWLSDEERRWLTGAIETQRRATAGLQGFAPALRDARVWVLTFMFFTFGISSYGVIFWIPQIIKQIPGISTDAVGWTTSAIWICAIIAMTLVGRNSDRTNERYLHFAASMVIGALGLIGSVLVGDPVVALVLIGIGAVGIWCGLGVFWTIPQQLFSGAAAAGCIALINATGNLGGYVGPKLMAFSKDSFGSFATGLVALGVIMIAGAAAALVMKAATRGTTANAGL